MYPNSAQAVVVQTFAADGSLGASADYAYVTASCAITLPSVAACVIGHSVQIVVSSTASRSVVLVANAADKIEGASKLNLRGSNVVATITPIAANRWAVSVSKGVAVFTHAVYALTSASGASPWTIGGSVFTDISAGSGNSVAAVSGLEFAATTGGSYYTSSTGAVVKTPISGLLDGWSRPLRSDDEFYMLVQSSRTTGSGTNVQTGIVLAGSTISATPKVGFNMEATAGDLQINLRVSSTTTFEDTTTSHIVASNWLGGRWRGRMKEMVDPIMSTSPSGTPGTDWWPTDYLNAVSVSNGEGLAGQPLDLSALTDIHMTMVGAGADKYTMTSMAILRVIVGSQGA